jgi:hypothetical protein
MALSRIDTTNMIEDVPQSKLDNNINFRNIIINGDMSIAQRGTSFADSSTYNLDRFNFAKNNDGAVTITQDTDVPSGQGFSKSLKVDVTTADTSIGASQYAIFNQRIEAQNLQYLKYGTANAETLTLSFWVKSNKTGTYCVSLIKIDNTRYDYVAEYSISSASTWEKKTITIAPDSNIKAAGGAIDNNNDIGFYLQFALADGSSRQGTNETWNTSTPATSTSNQVNFLDSTANEWYVTGVQLEAGQTASEFEFLPFDINYQRCKRYYQKTYDYSTAPGTGIENGWSWYGTDYNVSVTSTFQSQGIKFETQMRSSPSLTLYDGQGNSGKCTRYRVGAGPSHNNSSSADLITTTNFRHFGQGTAATGNIAFHYEASAEL